MIAIAGVTGCRNRGVDALVRVLVERLAAQCNEDEFVLFSRDVQFDSRVVPSCVKVVNDVWKQSSRVPRLRRRAAAMFPAMDRRYSSASALLQRARALVITGGDIFTSDYGDMTSYIEIAERANAHNVPVILAAHSVGPFATEAAVSQFKTIKKLATLISIRETASLRYIAEHFDYPADDFPLVADPAFLLTPASDSDDDLLKYYGLQPDMPVVGISCSAGVTSFKGETQRQRNTLYDDHCDALCRVCEVVSRQLQSQILLIPHVQERDPGNDDRIVANDIVKRLGYQTDVKVAFLNHTSEEFKYLLGKCTFVIAERMHAAIGALSSGVPTCIVRYSQKADGLVDDLFSGSSQKPLITLDQLIHDTSAAVDAIKRFFENRETIATALRTSLPIMQNRARAGFDLISNII